MQGELVEYIEWFFNKRQKFVKSTKVCVGFHVLKAINSGEVSRCNEVFHMCTCMIYEITIHKKGPC